MNPTNCVAHFAPLPFEVDEDELVDELEREAVEDGRTEEEGVCAVADRPEGREEVAVDDGTDEGDDALPAPPGRTVRVAYKRVSDPTEAGMNETPEIWAAGTPTSTPDGASTLHKVRPCASTTTEEPLACPKTCSSRTRVVSHPFGNTRA
ncbi:hypothetical protein EU513_13985 [Yimella sp. RIT 621]|uniref:hypothetical protein n=1 Tax=Yimella sp. RIT 621 TaxID=2510323 RepID=UPI00101B9C2B|nr:hypothetical protein [Yimella sp. RIT 621]RYG76155.1 hypothetical protein EU513_13985 [Yimella sp. RIT 621]